MAGEVAITLRIVDHFSRELGSFSNSLNSSQAAAAKLGTGMQGTGDAVSKFAGNLSRFADDGAQAVQQVATLRDRMVSVSEAFREGKLTASEAARQLGNISTEASASSRNVKDLGSANQVLRAELERVGVEAKNDAEHFKKMADEQKNAAAQMAEFKQQAIAAAAILAGFGAALVGAFKFGELGAKVEQTTRSFSAMTKSVGAGPELLDRLRAATRGTVNDLSLMQSAQTALIGLTGDFGKAMADALPQILSIAKAANLANPSLGTTDFLFDSLTKGLKRISPRLIDNTGLQLRLGEANEILAAQLGKSAESLTAEERQLALLNATLKAGDVLIGQIGGSTESATDEFARFTAETTNLKNELAQAFAPAAARVVGALNALITGNERVAQAAMAHAEQVRQTAATYREYQTEILRIERVTGISATALGLQGRAAWEASHGVVANAEALKRQQAAAASATGVLGSLEAGFSRGSEEAGRHTRALAMVEEQTRTAAFAADLLRAGLTGGIGQAQADYNQTLDETRGELAEVTVELNAYLAAHGNTEKIEELTQKKQALTDKIDAAQESMKRLTAEFLFQRISSALSAEASLELARSLGLIDEASYNAAAKMQALNRDFEAGKLTAAGYKMKVLELNDAIQSMQDKTVTINVNTSYTASGTPTGEIQIGEEPGPAAPVTYPTEEEDETTTTTGGLTGLQRGGSFVVPPGYNRDNWTVGVSSGERVIVQTPTQQTRRDNAISLTIASGAIAIYQQPGQDARALAREVMAELGRQTRAAVQSGAGIMGA